MIPRPFAEVASVGVALPPRVLTNHDLTRMLDTSDEWIVERTGIRERRIAGPEQSVAMLSREASEIAMERAGVSPADLDSIILATASPDRLLPSTACDLETVRGPIGRGKARATVDGDLAVRGTLTFALGDARSG